MFEEKDWKKYLREEDKEILAKMLDSAKQHKCAYLQADDVKVAQLWCCLIEIRKLIADIEKVVGKVAEPFKAIAEFGEAEKRRTIERIVREIFKPEPEDEEAIKRLVNSLMKF